MAYLRDPAVDGMNRRIAAATEAMLAAREDFNKYIAAAKAGEVPFHGKDNAYTDIDDSQNKHAEKYREYEEKITALEEELDDAKKAAKDAEGQGESSGGLIRGSSFSLDDVKRALEETLDERDERESVVAISSIQSVDALSSQRTLKLFRRSNKDVDCGVIGVDVGAPVTAFPWNGEAEVDATPRFLDWVKKYGFCSSKQHIKNESGNTNLLSGCKEPLGLNGGVDLAVLKEEVTNSDWSDIEAAFELKKMVDEHGKYVRIKKYIPQAIAECVALTYLQGLVVPVILTNGCEFVVVLIDGSMANDKIIVNVRTLVSDGNTPDKYKFKDDVRPAIRMIHTILSTYHHCPIGVTVIKDTLMKKSADAETDSVANIADVWDELDGQQQWLEMRKWAYSQMGLLESDVPCPLPNLNMADGAILPNTLPESPNK